MKGISQRNITWARERRGEILGSVCPGCVLTTVSLRHLNTHEDADENVTNAVRELSTSAIIKLLVKKIPIALLCGGQAATILGDPSAPAWRFFGTKPQRNFCAN